MALPPVFLFQGFPGPVGDPGPKGSRVSEFWLVLHWWACEWKSLALLMGSWEVRATRGAGISRWQPLNSIYLNCKGKRNSIWDLPEAISRQRRFWVC